mmetsp:Transcript_8567/g.24792  ORF Transcript_8567/g.24792 Transcript_8567/m.24792 type:complete len:350 (+) Transcript_8567:331-1380(+)
MDLGERLQALVRAAVDRQVEHDRGGRERLKPRLDDREGGGAVRAPALAEGFRSRDAALAPRAVDEGDDVAIGVLDELVHPLELRGRVCVLDLLVARALAQRAPAPAQHVQVDHREAREVAGGRDDVHEGLEHEEELEAADGDGAVEPLQHRHLGEAAHEHRRLRRGAERVQHYEPRIPQIFEKGRRSAELLGNVEGVPADLRERPGKGEDDGGPDAVHLLEVVAALRRREAHGLRREERDGEAEPDDVAPKGLEHRRREAAAHQAHRNVHHLHKAHELHKAHDGHSRAQPSHRRCGCAVCAAFIQRAAHQLHDHGGPAAALQRIVEHEVGLRRAHLAARVGRSGLGSWG